MIIWLKNVSTILIKNMGRYLQKSLLNRQSIVHDGKTLKIIIIIYSLSIGMQEFNHLTQYFLRFSWYRN